MAALLTGALTTLGTSAPAAALRSGPDVAVGSEQSGTAARAPVERAGQSRDSSTRWHGAETGYVSPVPGVDPPSGVARRFDPPEEEWGPGHRGVDLIAAPGASVLSPGQGIVTFVGQVARRGVVVVTHPDGLRTSLEPVAASVPVGTAVGAGVQVGVVEEGGGGGGMDGGGGGGSTTPNHCAPRSCVHWGVRRGDRYIDPLSLLDRPPIVLLPDR